ncbi:hypothetical protein [Desulfurispira natronophila]|uniref:Microcystin degradation protein MlrC n=1 Tax=Desulfurispira natronophila TaxID=682562 RepID=A0A7W7Y309_9BACT|nr:microcystin degradation protein MlrC [Desulfurispira natronophila]
MTPLLLCSLALAINVPLGFLRQFYAKFSLGWIVCIHASVPIILYMRTSNNIGWELVPLTLAAAVAGQVVGSYFHRHWQVA